MKNNFIKVKSDVSLVRDMTSDAIVNRNKSEFDKFINLSKIKYKEKSIKIAKNKLFLALNQWNLNFI